MKIRIGLKSGKELEMVGNFKKPEEIIKDIHENNYIYYKFNENTFVKTLEITYIEEIKEKKEMNFNQQVEAKEFQNSLKEFQEYLRKIETFKYKDFI